MKPHASLIAIGLLFFFAACGDTPSKVGSPSNNVNNLNNVNNVSSELANYCAMNVGEYNCENSASFVIDLEIEPGCGQFGQFEDQCGITPERLETCRLAVETCPQEDLVEYIDQRCGELIRCLVDGGNNVPNNANNINNTNNANNGGTYTEEFQAVAGILRQNCLDAACHGSFSTTNFVVPNDQLTGEAGIRDALEGVEAQNGNLLVAPEEPEASEIYRILLQDDGIHSLSSDDLDTIENWILNGARYTD